MTSGYPNVLAEFKYMVNTYRDNVNTCNFFLRCLKLHLQLVVVSVVYCR
jgi:hypothetical protein